MHRLVLFGGGTGMHKFIQALESCSADTVIKVTYVVAVSDNGGSSWALRNSFGGPAIGDARNVILMVLRVGCSLLSQCQPLKAALLSKLFNDLHHRVPVDSKHLAKEELALKLGAIPFTRAVSLAVTRFLNDTRFVSFDARGASLGNIVLFSLLLFHWTTGTVEPVAKAFEDFAQEVCCINSIFQEAGKPIQFEFLPSMDLTRAQSPREIAERASQLLPTIDIELLLENGIRLDGQCMISYGGVPSFRTDKSTKVATFLSFPTKLQYRFHPHNGYQRSPPATTAVKTATLCIFCRGSLVSSMVASALPYTSLLGMTFQPLVFLLNSSEDRESSFLSDSASLKRFIHSCLEFPSGKLLHTLVGEGSDFERFVNERNAELSVQKVPSKEKDGRYDDVQLLKLILALSASGRSKM